MRFTLLVLFAACSAPLLAADSLESAVALRREKKYPEARAALERIVAAEPSNAEAAYQLGLVCKLRAAEGAYEEALKWLARAVELAPQNPRYLADYGGTSLQLAARIRSISAATKGRDAVEKALSLNPDDLDARQGLYEFYMRAPWPLGSSGKAAAHLAELRKRDPDRATALSVASRVNAKEYDAAFKLCEEVLARKPDDYTALYQYGRTASFCGQNLARAVGCLQKCLTLPPPSPASPSHASVWYRLGVVQEKLGQLAEARLSYQAALREDPGHAQAADSLTRLK